MVLEEIVAQVRAVYVTDLARAVAAAPGAHVEPVLRTRDGLVAIEGELGLGIRADVLTIADGIPYQTVVTSTEISSFSRFETRRGGVLVVAQPFAWDRLLVAVDQVRGPADWRCLVAWFEKYFDAEDALLPQDNGLYGVVHFLSDPIGQNGGWRFEVDLGSAPTKAFLEFIEVLAALEPGRIVVGADPKVPQGAGW